MPTLQDLEIAIDNLLIHPLGISRFELVQRVGEKAYEAYIFALCLRAVRELNATPVLRGITGTPDPFIFRGGPGQIHSRMRNYGYIEFELNGHFFEIHAGVEFKGTSGMTHELDVCLMRSDDAQQCRQQPDDPPAASLVGCWECKFYAGDLSKVHGRAFVGLTDDMGSNYRLSGLCSNSDHVQLRNYLKPKARPYPNFRLTPLNPSNEDIFVNQLKAELKKMTAG
ncbi:MAG: hypothetical protein ABSE07_03540 [Methanoregula sp.]